MSTEHKAFQIIRDPRAVLASWKKLSYSKGNKYLNIIFQWIDAVNYCEKNKRKYIKSFIVIKFEDIHNDPKNQTKLLCDFVNIKFAAATLLTPLFFGIVSNIGLTTDL